MTQISGQATFQFLEVLKAALDEAGKGEHRAVIFLAKAASLGVEMTWTPVEPPSVVEPVTMSSADIGHG